MLRSLCFEMALKSVEIYANAVEYIMKTARLIGLGIFDVNYKVINIMSLLLVFDMITYTMVTIYCCWNFSGDLEKSIFNLVTYGFAIQVVGSNSTILSIHFFKFIQGASKLQIFWLKNDKILLLQDRILKFQESASNENSTKVYEKYAGYCVLGAKLIKFLFFSAGIVSILYPAVVILITGEIVLPYGFKLPWINERSFIGYIINFLHHLLQDYLVVCGLTTSDGIYAFEMLHAYCVFDDLCAMLDELNEDLKDKKKKKSPEITKKIVLIIEKHQNLLRLIRRNQK